MEGVTTIQIHENVKSQLDRINFPGRKSYGEIIAALIDFFEKQKRQQKALMVEGCKAMAEDSKKINEEWSAVDSKWF